VTWVRIDDQFLTHPKVIAAGKDGRAMFIAGLCYSSSNLTDGFIPLGAVPIVAAMAEVKPTASAQLVKVGLWETVPDGYAIHDFLDYQPSRVDVEQQRGDLSKKRAAAGRKGAERRWQSERQTDGNGHGKAMANGMANGSQTDGPIPSHPQLLSSSSELQVAPPGLEEDQDRQAHLAAVVSVIARRKLQAKADRGEEQPRDTAAWCATVERVDSAALAAPHRIVWHQHRDDWTPERFADHLEPTLAERDHTQPSLEETDVMLAEREQAAAEASPPPPSARRLIDQARARNEARKRLAEIEDDDA